MPDRIVSRIVEISGRNVALRLERLYWRELTARAKRCHMPLRDLLAAAIGGADSRAASALIRRKLFAWRGAEIDQLNEEIARLTRALAARDAELALLRRGVSLPASWPAVPELSSPPGRQAVIRAPAAAGIQCGNGGDHV